MGLGRKGEEDRKLVSHKSVLVNDAVVNIPSYTVRTGDIVSIRQKARQQLRIQSALALAEQKISCDWVTVEAAQYKGTLNRAPGVDDFASIYNVNLVVEFYSK